MRPVRRSDRWRSNVPGILILVGLVTISTAVFLLDGIRRALVEGPEIVVLAAEGRGLVPGSDVWVAGSPAGRVKSVVFADPHGPTESRVVIRATLVRTAVPFLRADTRASISSAALLAPLVLKLDPGHPGSGPLDITDTLRVPPERSTEQMLS
ncbi:MAG: MCE family protein, partial [Gemmatimonadota bacterium]